MFPGGSYGSAQKKVDKATTKRVIDLFRPYPIQIFWTITLVLLSAALGLLTPFFLKSIVNDGLAKHDLGVVMKYSLLSLAATLVATGLSIVFGYLSVLVGQKIMRDLRNNLYAHLQGMSLKFFTGTRTGEIQSRLVNDVGGIQSVVSDTLANVLSNLATALSTLVAMAIFDWRLTLLSVGILPIFAVLSQRVGGSMRKIRGEVQGQLANLNALMNETLSVSGVLLMKTSGRQSTALAKFTEENRKLTDGNVKIATYMRMFFMLTGLAFSITPVLVYWLAGYLIIGNGDKHLDIGTIVAFTSLQPRLFFPLTGLLNVQVEVTSAFALFDRIFEYIDMPQDITEQPDAIPLPANTLRGEVMFTDVSFRYETSQTEPTLKGINLEAKPGELVALVGPSGAGKTTLTYLIPRLYDVESGSVAIDGIDVRRVQLSSLGQIIGVVTQETYLVHDTILENLRYGNPNASQAEIVAAAKAAAIHDHIASLPEGYDTVVGERGYKLSGGEKQRVAIARAILKDPRILILDEATSALDTQSERLVQTALAQLMKGRTTFAIAHRLSTIQAADQILVVVDGQIVERGSHSSLLALGGEYANLYETQLSVQEAPQEP